MFADEISASLKSTRKLNPANSVCNSLMFQYILLGKMKVVIVGQISFTVYFATRISDSFYNCIFGPNIVENYLFCVNIVVNEDSRSIEHDESEGD